MGFYTFLLNFLNIHFLKEELCYFDTEMIQQIDLMFRAPLLRVIYQSIPIKSEFLRESDVAKLLFTKIRFVLQ